MQIGVVKEIKPDEHRVALTPAGAVELRRRGHEVLVERGAGEGSALPDSAYEAVGAQIGSVDEVWSNSDLVLKVKEPLPQEFDRLRDGLVLFTYLHLAADDDAHSGTARERRDLHRLRDGRDRRPPAAPCSRR